MVTARTCCAVVPAQRFVEGEDGNGRAIGGFGPVHLDGGRGADVVRGGPGADQIYRGSVRTA